jgi:hypothetical protein
MTSRISDPIWTRLGVRVESSEEARQLHWLLERFDAGRIRAVAYSLRLRESPKPERIARELGACIPAGHPA